MVRPSGTEPKLKCYLEVVVEVGDSVADARAARREQLRGIGADLLAALQLRLAASRSHRARRSPSALGSWSGAAFTSATRAARSCTAISSGACDCAGTGGACVEARPARQVGQHRALRRAQPARVPGGGGSDSLPLRVDVGLALPSARAHRDVEAFAHRSSAWSASSGTARRTAQRRAPATARARPTPVPAVARTSSRSKSARSWRRCVDR